MSEDTLQLSRRSFLRLSAAAGGGLLLSLYLKDSDFESMGSKTPFAPSGFIRIDPDGTITLWGKNPDMGQGVKTSMPMILAEELDADWSKVKIEQADLNTPAYGAQGSGGSDSIRSDWDEMRKAGSIARQLLILAAAEKWNVRKTDCRTQSGIVTHSNKKVSYGELASRAAQLSLKGIEPKFKDPSEYKIIGSRRNGIDNPRIVTGQPLYGIDVRVPGMLHAAIAKSTVYGAKPLTVDSTETMKVPGVQQVVQFDGLENPTHLQPGVAVIASNSWAAMQGRKALKVTWDDAKGRDMSSDMLSKQFRENVSKPGTLIRESGNVEKALAEAKFKVEADYEAPFLPHATLEPQNCTASVKNGECEVWGPMQMPMSAQRVVNKATGIPPEKIKIHITRLGGGFGRRLMSDYAAEAAVISQKIGAPVQTLWTREDDMTHDYYRTASYHRVRAALDAGGNVSAWTHHLSSVSRNDVSSR